MAARVHSLTESAGVYGCRLCDATASSVTALSRIPCASRAIEQPRVGVADEGVE